MQHKHDAQKYKCDVAQHKYDDHKQVGSDSGNGSGEILVELALGSKGKGTLETIQMSCDFDNISLAIRGRFGNDSGNDWGKILVELVLGPKGKGSIGEHADFMYCR